MSIEGERNSFKKIIHTFEASVMLCNISVLIKLLMEECLSWDK